jgi:hypothetical protein
MGRSNGEGVRKTAAAKLEHLSFQSKELKAGSGKHRKPWEVSKQWTDSPSGALSVSSVEDGWERGATGGN